MFDPVRRANPSHSRHAQIHNDEIGAQFGLLLQTFGAVAGLAADLKVGLIFQERADAPAHEFVIVHNENAFARARGPRFCSAAAAASEAAAFEAAGSLLS